MPERDPTEKWAEFLATLPPHIRAVAEKYPMTRCYRSTQNQRFHYKIHSYDGYGPGSPVTVTLVHGADSTLPGVGAIGQPPDQLIACDCGNWRMPTKQEAAEGQQYARKVLSEERRRQSTEVALGIRKPDDVGKLN